MWRLVGECGMEGQREKSEAAAAGEPQHWALWGGGVGWISARAAALLGLCIAWTVNACVVQMRLLCIHGSGIARALCCRDDERDARSSEEEAPKYGFASGPGV